MLYFLFRPFVALLLKFSTKRLKVSGLENIPKSGAVLLAANHFNSFFDALLICCMIDRRVWSLARGDVFKKSWAKKLLSSLFMLPMYRLSEGRENLGDNDDTFKKCIELFEQGELVLIFSEGISTNQKTLLPLKKGTGRLAQKAWGDNMDITVIPVGIKYNNYDRFGKIINLQIGEPINKQDFAEITTDGFFLKAFNESLTEKLKALLDVSLPKVSFWKNPVYFIGSVVNFPAYFLSIAISRKLTKGSVFFDSITVGMMLVILPIYWILVGLLIYFLTKTV